MDSEVKQKFQKIVSHLAAGGIVKAEWYGQDGLCYKRMNIKRVFIGNDTLFGVNDTLFGVDEFERKTNLADANIFCIQE
ncbi:MAG: hypothetical protein LBT46_15465 [Planctomycetaceae bacterium]|jgi:hypothetical protein|nr:hypothetical protein [Planctomycetaceae bacterium]